MINMFNPRTFKCTFLQLSWFSPKKGLSSNDTIPKKGFAPKKDRLKEEEVWGAGAPHPLIDAQNYRDVCIKRSEHGRRRCAETAANAAIVIETMSQTLYGAGFSILACARLPASGGPDGLSSSRMLQSSTHCSPNF